jgi:hypothetical protein
MSGTHYNKIRLGRRASLFNMNRLKTAAIYGAVACAGLTLLAAKLIQ